MTAPGGLVVLHIDGLGRDTLLRAVDEGGMPEVARLLREEGYTALPYRCGIPSTTPFAQAGILYGDNREIPSFRWFDRDAGAVIGFGAGSTFKQFAHKYFRGTRPLCESGACIAAALWSLAAGRAAAGTTASMCGFPFTFVLPSKRSEIPMDFNFLAS